MLVWGEQRDSGSFLVPEGRRTGTHPGYQLQQLEDAAVEEPSTAAPETSRKNSCITYFKL